VIDPLEGIEHVVFDKDGTLIDFQLMWGEWVRALARDLARSTGLTIADQLYPLLGVDASTGRVHPHGLLAATPMSRIRGVVVGEIVERGVEPEAAEAAVAAAWHPPDPVALARPLADLPRLFAALHLRVRHLTVATSDDREPTERTLAALGIADQLSAIACADDGWPVKPAPDSVLTLCEIVGVARARTAVVGDAPVDIEMGRAARVRRTIGVLTGVGDRASLERIADLVLPSINDLDPAGG
jgi:phosphoglycolate phosphatase